ncbi:MAG: formate dehydrogenase family accessory protein FdhD [Euryarchaeota archaeon]|nr:formate dehydrogenase family accessory protein FdhD [Euryarchaeota archaeon]OUW22558.1 MAG: formate dehydrogenase family accessory protein FdhD [Euryarchaeota archaeon TMED173]
MKGSEKRGIYRYSNHDLKKDYDFVASESPLKISIIDYNGLSHNLGITMRTIGNDRELIIGFLYAEGIIDGFNDVEEINLAEEVVVKLSKSATFDPSIHLRTSTVTSACGICGRMSAEGFVEMAYPQISEGFMISIDVINNSILKMTDQQILFSETGGSHACASFDVNGVLVHIFEDVGRHNAMDKLVGAHIAEGKIPVTNNFAIVSGRASYELVQKSIRAGFSALIAIGAPSTLAIDLAREYGITLACFAKNESLNVYSGSRRIQNKF